MAPYQRLPVKQRVLLLLKDLGPMTRDEIAHSLRISSETVRRAIHQMRADEALGSPRRIYVSHFSTGKSRGGGATRRWAVGNLPDADEVQVVVRTLAQPISPKETIGIEWHREEARRENERLLSAQLRAIAAAPGNPFAGLIWQATQ